MASDTICTQLMMRDTSMSIVTASTVSPLYDGGHDQALVDGLRGGKDFRTGGWQGYEGQDLEVAIERGSTTTISTVRASFLQDENSWIFMPTEVIILSAADGKHYQEVGRTVTKTDPHAKGTIGRGCLSDRSYGRTMSVRIGAERGKSRCVRVYVLAFM